MSSRPIGRDRGGILQLEVAPHELLGLGEERRFGLGVELQVGELGIGAQLGDGLLEAERSGRASVRSAVGQVEQALEGEVHERALGWRASDGGSGSRSMAENRNASAQSLNDDTFDGDSVAGRGNDMRPLYAGGLTLSRRLRGAPTPRSRRNSRGYRPAIASSSGRPLVLDAMAGDIAQLLRRVRRDRGDRRSLTVASTVVTVGAGDWQGPASRTWEPYGRRGR